MLHVFHVNCGEMLTFDVNLAMEKVSELKSAISQHQGISVADQVFLISTGQPLCDDKRVCSFSAAGTETNPVFLFNAANIEKNIVPVLQSLQSENDFRESVHHALTLQPSYATVKIRTNLAIQLNDSTHVQVNLLKAVIEDQRRMSQGWEAALANLKLTHFKFLDRYPKITSHCRAKLQHIQANTHTFEGMEDTFAILSRIPVLPSLLKDGLCSSVSLELDQSKVSLLHWIEANCKNVSLKNLLDECKERQEYLSQKRMESLVEACAKAGTEAENKSPVEISGLKERLRALKSFIVTADQLAADQEGITKGFVKNRTNAKYLENQPSNSDAMQTLCESHVRQLKIMVVNESNAKESLKHCIRGKNGLAETLHRRLRWLYCVQKKINEADTSLCMFLQRLISLERQIEFLAQVKLAPNLYLSSLTEVVRRKHFRNTYLKAVANANGERDKELLKRETFQSNVAGHFIQKLFDGLLDKPPALTKKAVNSFDNNLPEVTEDQLKTLSHLLPKYKDILQVSLADSDLTSESSTRSNQTSSFITSGEENATQTERATSPKLHSVSANTGSFAVVDSLAISKGQPSTHVDVSGDEKKKSTDDPKFENLHTEQNDATDLPQRADSSVTLTNESIPQSLSNSQLDDDMAHLEDTSVGSAPDSEFFSILPRQFGDGNPPHLLNQNNDEVISVSPVVIPGSFESLESFPQRLSVPNVGSLDSNSYQKVDDLCSDDDSEMFHSITNDHHDLSDLRSKLQKVQSDYDKLLESSTHEKEEFNLLIKKIQNESEVQKEIQQASADDFEKRWNDSKLELDALMKQLQEERAERQKAQNGGADLEKSLEMATERYALQEGIMHDMKQKLGTKTEELRQLQIQATEMQRNHEAELSDKTRETQEFMIKKDNETANLEYEVQKVERLLSLTQVDLDDAEDRIQELEDVLYACDCKEQEREEQAKAYEAKINELSNQLEVALESQQESSNKMDEASKKAAKSETALANANEQIASLTKLVADGEDKMRDYGKTIENLRQIDEQYRTLESEKSQLELKVQSLNSTIDAKEVEFQTIVDELHETQSIVKDNAESSLTELSELQLTHLDEQHSLCKQHEEYVAQLTESFETELNELTENSKKALYDKEQEMKKLIRETCVSHRNERAEEWANDQEKYANVLREAKLMKEKLNKSYRQLDQEKTEAAELEGRLTKEIRSLERECIGLRQGKEDLEADKTCLQKRLAQAELEIQSMRQQSNQETVNTATQVTMSTDMDDERDSKISSTGVDSGSLVDGRGSSVDLVALEASTSDLGLSNRHEVDALKESFRMDKRALEKVYKKRHEDATRRSQVVFNSAIQRLSATKDLQIKKLQEQLMVQSQPGLSSTLSQSMMAPTQEMTMSMVQPTTFLPSPSAAKPQPCTSQSESEGALPSQTPDSTRERNRVTVANFKSGDTVLVCFNDAYSRYTLFTISRTLHFIHQDSIRRLGLHSTDHEAKKTMTFAVFVEKEYCQARKAQNRFGIPVGTKFYRIRVSPFSKKD